MESYDQVEIAMNLEWSRVWELHSPWLLITRKLFILRGARTCKMPKAQKRGSWAQCLFWILHALQLKLQALNPSGQFLQFVRFGISFPHKFSRGVECLPSCLKAL